MAAVGPGGSVPSLAQSPAGGVPTAQPHGPIGAGSCPWQRGEDGSVSVVRCVWLFHPSVRLSVLLLLRAVLPRERLAPDRRLPVAVFTL